jgi:hypothetical protein
MLWFLAWEHHDSDGYALFWSLEASGDDPQPSPGSGPLTT